MFSAGFQLVAFQTAIGQGVATITGGLPKAFSYFPAWQQNQQAQIKKQKTEIQKLDSVINEYERRRALAEESLRLAAESEHQRLMAAQNELLTEINRLLMVKAEMMARVRKQEEFLLLAIIARKRLRAFNVDTTKGLLYV